METAAIQEHMREPLIVSRVSLEAKAGSISRQKQLSGMHTYA